MSGRRTGGTALREPRPRIMFDDLVLHQVGNRCSAQVMLSLSKGVEVVGSAEGDASERGRLRTAAEATAKAIEGAAQGELKLTVLNVTLVETVDAMLVLVALASRGKQDGERLVGSCLVKGQDDRSAVFAVLSATNRLVGLLLQ
jgi:hypothetical protein